MRWYNALVQLNREAQSHVLITVLDTRGSSPRDTGSKMVVSDNKIVDTIGGGALEYKCIETARGYLDGKPKNSQHTEKYNLGADLNQCCGGVVSVLFEVFPACDFVVNIFGAGHIGQALTKLLCDIDCKVNWFDSRPELFTKNTAENITTHSLNQPELAVESCGVGCYFLVMTHDHALDQQLCESIIARGDSAYCGVIGSRTKGIKFRQRLRKKGFTPQELKQLTCPMGLNDFDTKQPMEIAVSVLAELLILRNKSSLLSVKGINAVDEKVVPFENRD